MKPYVYILAAVSAALIVLQSCNNTPASAVEGDYIPEAQSVQINGVIINLADWPGCSVSIRSIDGDNAEVTLDSLLLGFDTLTVKCSVTSQGRDKYAFSGDFEDNDRDIGVSGTVNKGRLSISITDIFTSPVTGRWTPAMGEDGLIKLSLQLSSPVITDDSAAVRLQEAARAFVTPLIEDLGYIELDRTGYVNISWNGQTDDIVSSLLSGVIQYYPLSRSGTVHLYLRRTVADGAGLPASPADIPFAYSVSGNTPSLTADKDGLNVWVAALLSLMEDYGYSDYINDGSPLGEMTEEEFSQLQAMLTLASGIIAMPATEYSITAQFEKS